MQSGYGVPETQQFMMDGCSSSLLSISHDINNSSQPQKQHLQYHHHHLHHHQLQQQQQQQRYLHIQHHIPVTQPFFQQQNHPFQAFQHHQQRQLHQHVGLDHESGPENSNSPSRMVGGSGPPFIVANFKLAVNEENSSGSRRVVALNDDDEALRGRREDGSDRWKHREQDSAIKEPFWKPLDIEYMNRNNKRCKEKMETSYEFCKKAEKVKETEEGKSSSSNYGFFGELEAIYTAGGVGNGGNNQTGSGSALTGDNPPAIPAVLGPGGDPRGGVDHASETSTGEEATLEKLQKNRRKKNRKQLGTIAIFFESLVQQLMEHQESLYRKFLEVMEKRDQERMDREEACRQQEAEKSNRQARARAQEHALASSREATIIAFLEKFTGETINLPTKTQFQFPSHVHEESHRDEKPMEAEDVFTNTDITSNDNTPSNNVDSMNMNITRRWPKAEVQTLIRVRSSLESKFQEPGLKGPLWEQVSSSMASMGYQRSSKRCKEKWENINKYFRKTKDTAKKRSQQSKTCPYFHQLDQLYSKSLIPSHKSSDGPKNRSELLDAIVVTPDHGNSQNPPPEFSKEQINVRRGFHFPDMGSLGLDFNRSGSDNPHEEDEDEDDAVEGESQEHVQNQGIEREHGDKKHPHEPLFFGLES